ncbi:hypothetical protein D3C72_2257890 [compost metagenome]
MVDHMFGGIADKRRRDAGTAQGTQYHDARLQVLSQVGDYLFRQAFFNVGEFFVNAEFLS